MGYIQFIKKSSGNVWIKNKTNGRVLQLPPTCQWEMDADRNEFRFWNGANLAYTCNFADIDSTQVEPAAAIAVTTPNAFITLLDSSFFFSVSGGGGTADQIEFVDGSMFLVSSGSEASISLTVSPTNNAVPNKTDFFKLYLTSSGAITLNGIQAPPTNREQIIWIFNKNNQSTGATVTLAKEAAASTATNRFCFPPATVTIQAGGSRLFIYQNTPLGWRWCAFF